MRKEYHAVNGKPGRVDAVSVPRIRRPSVPPEWLPWMAAQVDAIPPEEAPAAPHPLTDWPRHPRIGGVDALGNFRQWGALAFRKAAGRASHLTVNPPNAVACLLLDCDRPAAARTAWDTGRVPRPNWYRFDRATRRGHAGYVLAAGVHRNRQSSVKALAFLADVERSLVARTGSDPGFGSHSLTRNPWLGSIFEETEWGNPEPRELGGLIPQGGIVAAGRAAAAVGEGRNVALFRRCLRAAEAAAWELRREDPAADVSPILEPLRTFAAGWNSALPWPLPAHEVVSTVTSVFRYARRWTHWRRRLARAAGTRGGLRSGSARRSATAVRDSRILELRQDGLTLRAIAAEVGLSARGVGKVVNRTVQG